MSSNTKVYEEKMKSSVEHLSRELAAVRAGRANPAVLDKVSVDYYGAPTPIQQVASVDVAHGDLCILTQLGDLLGQLLAALLGGSGEVQPDGGAVIDGGDAHITCHDGLADGAQQGAVPRGNGQSACFGHSHGCHLLDGSGGTIIIHADLIQHSGICAACAHSAQFAAQMFDRALHLVFVNLGVAAHCGSLLFLFILGLRCNASAL